MQVHVTRGTMLFQPVRLDPAVHAWNLGLEFPLDLEAAG